MGTGRRISNDGGAVVVVVCVVGGAGDFAGGVGEVVEA